MNDLMPPKERDLDPVRLAAMKRLILDRVAAERPVRRRRARVVALVLVPAAMIGAVAGYAGTRAKTAEQVADMVTCYQSPSVSAPAFGFPSAVDQDLAAACRRAWTSGALAWPVPGPAPSSWVACSGPEGGAAVFPGDHGATCESLHLEPLPPDYAGAVARFSALRGDMAASFPDGSCVNPSDAETQARTVLERDGFAAWRVTATGFSEAAPCAAVSLDPVNGVAMLSGIVEPALSDAAMGGAERTSFCGPEATMLSDIRDAIIAAGFEDWTVTADHAPSAQWPCYAGLDFDPATRSVILKGHATR